MSTSSNASAGSGGVDSTADALVRNLSIVDVSSSNGIAQNGAMVSVGPNDGNAGAEAEAETRTNAFPPSIPYTALAHALEFLPYEQILSALTAGKSFRGEMIKGIRALNFTKAAQIGHKSSGRYFKNVDEVNCLSFVTVSWEDGKRADRLCDATYHRLVPFLTTFPGLRCVFIGGHDNSLDWRGGGQERDGMLSRRYFRVRDYDENVHRNQIVSFRDQIVNAIRSRLLSPTLESLDGVTQMLAQVGFGCHGDSDGGMCENCRVVCEEFPILNAMEMNTIDTLCNCIARVLRYEAIVSRDERARALFPKNLQCMEWAIGSLRRLFRRFGLQAVPSDANWKEKWGLSQKLLRLGVPSDFPAPRLDVRAGSGDAVVGPCAYYLSSNDLEKLDRIIAVGLDLRFISRYGVGRALLQHMSGRAFAGKTVDDLASRGLDLAGRNIIVLDETTEPALAGLADLISGVVAPANIPPNGHGIPVIRI